jgi:hypothetical protein
VLGLLAHDLDGVVGPVLDELGVAPLELESLTPLAKNSWAALALSS